MRLSFSIVHSVVVKFQRLTFLSKPYCDVSTLRCYSSGLASSFNPTDKERVEMVKATFQRLPKDVVPKHYDLKVIPDLEKFTFQGELVVNVQVANSTSAFILNALQLTLDNVSYAPEVGDEVSATVNYSEENETATLNFPSNIAPGAGKLRIRYSGIVNDLMKGFYRTKYLSPNGETKYGACTQFESTDARRALPCWDEPAIKATFDVTLVANKDLVTLSNMDVISEKELANSLKEVKFATTPIMSTYLLAFVIGEYDFVEDVSDGNIKIRVFTPLGKKEQGRFALHVATKVLPYYRDYFNVEYPLPKLDLIAIPDFAMGAMENWGLVTYRETALLVDPVNSSSMATQYVALVVGHELAHQWFGNIVTMEWWTHLWLNEGFASWIEFLCVDFLFPEYDIWTQFVTDSVLPPFESDGLRNSHPIEVAVGHPSEVDEIFDDISYCKGASVIRMLHNYIGDEDFRKGMHQYLTKHKYGNTFTEDLWDALGKACNKPIATIMSTWTQQMGYPVIKVNVRQNDNSKLLTLSQDRFFCEGQVEGDNSLWVVPISISTSSSPDKVIKKVLLDSKTAEITLENSPPNEWIKLNSGMVGFYRCLYTDETLENFIPNIKDKSLPPLDRLGLQDDLFALVLSGHKSIVEYFKLLEAFVDEDNYTVWNSICNSLGRLAVIFSQTDYYELYQSFGRHLLTNVCERIGWNPQKNESHSNALLRALILGRMGAFGDQSVLNEARRRFDAHANKTSVLAADLRSPVYRTVMAVGDQKCYDTFLKLYRETDLQEEKKRLCTSMGSIEDAGILRKVLDFGMSDEVRSQDTISVVVSVGRNRFGREMAWQFYKENRDEFKKRFGSGHLLTILIKYLTEDFASEEKAKEVEAYFQENPVEGADRTILQSLENIRLHSKLLARDSASVKTWLNNRQ